MGEYLPPVDPPGFTAGDHDPSINNPHLEVAVRADKTLMVRIVGKRGRVFGWVELSRVDTVGLRNYLMEEV